MNDLEREVRDLLAPLRATGLKAVGPNERGPSHERQLSRVRQLVVTLPEIRRRARRQRTIAAFVATSAAALLLLALVRQRVSLRSVTPPDVVALRVLEGTATQGGGAEGRTLGQGATVWTGPAERLETAAGSRVQLETRGGLRVTAGPATRLLMDLRASTRSPWVQLLGGSVRCEVPKLGEGNHFVVYTPDANVVVHGTAFSVEIRDAGATPLTCVHVDAGVVGVLRADREDRLTQGQSSGCEDVPRRPPAQSPLVRAEGAPRSLPSATVGASAPAPPPASRNSTVAEGNVTTRSGAPPPANRDDACPVQGAASLDERRSDATQLSKAAEPIESTRHARSPEALAEQNQLLQRALIAESRGDKTLARESLRLLLARYPNSPLAPEAASVLARIGVDPVEMR